VTPPDLITTPIESQACIADRTFRLRVMAPRLAASSLPGQFAMVRIAGRTDPLLGRPLAVYDVDPQAGWAEFVYVVQGRFTRALAACLPGTAIGIVGPLGNGFPVATAAHLVLVAGGIGQTALLALGRERTGAASYGGRSVAVPAANRVTLLWGARTAAAFGDIARFRDAGIDVHLATLDGSLGHRGTVVDLMDRVLGSPGCGRRIDAAIACCGPEGMMAAVSAWAEHADVPCQVSLETPMACGVGICFSCVAAVRDPAGGWDWRRTCIEGPVFESGSIEWSPHADR
jgi:dihydroorotate dehydrogenase electron transfer subunit